MNTIKISPPSKQSLNSLGDICITSQGTKRYISTAHIQLQDVRKPNYLIQTSSDANNKDNGSTHYRSDELHGGLIARTQTNTALKQTTDRQCITDWQRDQSTTSIDQHQQQSPIAIEHAAPRITRPRLINQSSTCPAIRPAPRHRRTLPPLPCIGTLTLVNPLMRPNDQVTAGSDIQDHSTAANNDHAITSDQSEPIMARSRRSLPRSTQRDENYTKAPRCHRNTTITPSTDDQKETTKETSNITSTPTLDTNTTQKTQRLNQYKNSECQITAPVYDYGIKSVISCRKKNNNLSFRVTYTDKRKPK